SPASPETVDGFAAWSPDGTKLALETWSGCYRSAPVDSCYEQGGSVIVDTDGNVIGSAGLDPSWSPDGNRLVSDVASLDSDQEVIYDLAISNLNGSTGYWPRNGHRPRLPSGVCLGLQHWSPNGRWIAASTVACNPDTGGGFPDILYLFPLAGGKARALPNADGPIWSPDGRHLAFKRGRAFFIARGDGTHAHAFAKRAAD